MPIDASGIILLEKRENSEQPVLPFAMFHVKHFYRVPNDVPVKKKHFREVSKVPIVSGALGGI